MKTYQKLFEQENNFKPLTYKCKLTEMGFDGELSFDGKIIITKVWFEKDKPQISKIDITENPSFWQFIFDFFNISSQEPLSGFTQQDRYDLINSISEVANNIISESYKNKN